MKLVMLLVFGVVCALSGCAPLSGPVTPPIAAPDGAVATPKLWQPCDAERAEQWRLDAAGDPEAALHGAACYTYLLERGGGDPALATRGRQLAEQAVAAYPENATAHYLLAYLAGLEARHHPLRALSLVPVIEKEALAALARDPDLDQGGPARMLGDLYLRAPAFPVSVGDPALAVEYFQQALKQAPGFPENRLGLIEALLDEEETAAACTQLHRFWLDLAPAGAAAPVWQTGAELQRRLCEGIAGE